MKKHTSGFRTSTPATNFSHFYKDGLTPLQQHTEWLHNIRQTMWDRIHFENEMVPSTDALHRHWKRSCWVLDVWSQADKNTLNPKLLTEYGWLKDGGIVWDSDTNIKEVMLRVAGLLKGCGCKTGCQTQHCGCKGKNKKCGEGCECTNCSNTHGSPQTTSRENYEFIAASIEETISDSPLTEDLDDVIEWVLGHNPMDGDYEYIFDN